MGIIKPNVLRKPQALKSLEQCEMLGSLPLLGGTEDQPYIWLQAAAVCRSARDLYLTLKERNKVMNANVNP
jgi:hypothetical protein